MHNLVPTRAQAETLYRLSLAEFAPFRDYLSAAQDTLIAQLTKTDSELAIRRIQGALAVYEHLMEQIDTAHKRH